MVIFGEIETPTDEDQTPVAMASAFGTQNIQTRILTPVSK
jgi:hypothetical protein